MDNSLKILFDEHEVITMAIEAARKAKDLVEKNDEEYKSTINELIRFFKVYADQYHHHKEEEILFPEMEKKNELLADGVIKEMFDNHTHFRELLRAIESDVKKNDCRGASLKIDEYTEELLDHIAVENEEVFQAAYSLFTEDELENIYFRFVDLDRELGDARKNDFRDMLAVLGEVVDD